MCLPCCTSSREVNTFLKEDLYNLTCMPCNPALEHSNCCATNSIVSESTCVNRFVSTKPTAVLLDLGTLSHTEAIGVPCDVINKKSAKINYVSIIKCLANPLKSIIADEIIVDSGSAFHVISEDMIPPELWEYITLLDR